MHTLGGLALVFLYEIGTALVLPTPSELPIIGRTWLPIGWVFVVAVAGKILGSYLVFFLGDRMKETARFRRLADRYAWIRALLSWSERFVRRYGVVAVFVLLSIPGFPDTVSLYIFALVGRRPVLFAVAAGLGTAVRMGLVLAGVLGFQHATA
ncbi:MAG: VTT domain-containing protein [Candidatus Bipolaricaulota bacterium]|nr:VTT domain-containing protein [Candidatus Bipolaricaulota bacterium]